MIIKSQTEFCFPVTQLQKKSIFSTNKCPIFISSTGKHGTPRAAARRIQGKGCLSPLVCRGLLLGNCGATLGKGQESRSGEWWPKSVSARRYLPGELAGTPSCTSTWAMAALEPLWQKQQPLHPLRPQCPGLCKASTNFSMWFARVQTARLDLTDVQFHVMMYFMHSISVGPECWEVPSDSRASHFALLQAQILSWFIPTIKPYHQESWGGRNGSRIWV